MATSDADKIAELERRLAEYEARVEEYKNKLDVSEHERAEAEHESKRARIETDHLKQAVEQQQKQDLPAKDAELSAFWDDLSTTEPGDNRILLLSKAPFTPQDLKGLYIRECYQRMFDIMNKKLKNRVRRFAIIGTPGIGKSLFLFYLMWRLSRMESVNAVVLRRRQDDGEIFVFKKDVCFSTFEYSRVRKLLSNEATWYLTDSLVPPPAEVQAVTVLVASPAKKYYHDFIKYDPPIDLNYFPTWDLKELYQCAKYLFRTVNVVTIDERYSLIGGVPRFVLRPSIDLQRKIAQALNRMAIEKFPRIARGELETEACVSHFLLHFAVQEDLESYSLEFASSYVTDKACEAFSQNSYDQLLHFVSYAEGIAPVAVLRAQLFEQIAHRMLCEGQTDADGQKGPKIFDVKKLTESSPLKTKLELSEMTRTSFRDVSKCDKRDVYYYPKSKTFACIDAVIPSIGWFQMTTTAHHGIKMQAMAAHLNATAHIGIPKDIYFVVPKNLYSDFAEQSFKTQTGVDASKIKQDLRDLNQYALCLDIPVYSPTNQA